MVDLGTYIFKDLNTAKITPGVFFTNDYVEGVYESEHVRTSIKQLRIILYAKYENADLHKVVETQCQYLTLTQRNDSLKLLQKPEELFYVTHSTWKTDPVDFKLKYDYKPICLQPYPLTKVHEEIFKKRLEV